MKNNSILVYYSCLSEPFVFVFLMIQHFGEDPSNDGAQAKIAGDSVSDYLALQGPIIDDFDGEQALMDKEKDSDEKMVLKSFIQLLTGPISDDLFTVDLLQQLWFAVLLQVEIYVHLSFAVLQVSQKHG